MDIKKFIQNIQNTAPNREAYLSGEDSEREARPSAEVAPDPRMSNIHELLTLAAIRNQETEAGTDFKVMIPNGEQVTLTDVFVESAMRSDPNRPVPKEVDDNDNVVLFQATATSALAKYIENRAPRDNYDDDSSGMAAD